jgi:hypothetical protein
MRVLLVAPRTELKLVDEEAQDILRSGLDVTPLVGEVTSRELLREIRAASYDVLWLATHGEKRVNVFNQMEYGIWLTDGFMPSSELVAQVRGKFSLVYLNTCTSYRIAQEIQIDAGVSVVGTLLDVPDRAAYQTGSLFAAALAEGLSPEAAYLRSMPGGERIYMFLGSLKPSTSTLDLIVNRFDKLEQKISHDYAVALRSVVLSRWLLWVSLGLHVPEWIALWILWSGRGS